MRVQLIDLSFFLLISTLSVLSVSGEAGETWLEYTARTGNSKKSRGNGALRVNPDLHHRDKRSIAFPTGSTLTVTPILCVPVFSMGDISGALDLELPFTIKLPNTSDINAIGRSNDRIGIYNLLEESIEKFGLNGKSCLLRAVCEVAETPLRDDGLLGEVVNIILSASFETMLDTMEEYHKAEYRGKHYGDCWSAYPDCPFSIFKLLER